MTEIINQLQRSRLMSRIKSQNTKFEMDFLKQLSSVIYPQGYRYRKHYSRLIGKPDIVFVKNKIAIFLDSDFWHGRHFIKLKPKLKNKYWINKIGNNMKRDKRVDKVLSDMGWFVLRLSEQEIKFHPEQAIRKIIRALCA